MTRLAINDFMERWIAGDEAVFKKIVDHYYPDMHAFAFRMTRNREDTEELIMNAFLKLWQYKHRVEYVSKPDEYLFGILRREIVGHARKRIIQVEPIENIALTACGVSEHPEMTLQEIKARYQTALGKLTPRQRAVFQLSREQDMTQKEIAKETGLSVNTVGNHMNAALKVFREELKEYPEAMLFYILSGTTASLFFG